MATIDIAGLSPQERLDLIGQLWDSLDADRAPLTAAQRAELDRRLAEPDTGGARSWAEFRAELAARR